MPNSFSTYTRVLLSLSILAIYIKKLANTFKTNEQNIYPTRLLSAQEIEIALRDPQQSLTAQFKAYAQLVKQRKQVEDLREQTKSLQHLIDNVLPSIQKQYNTMSKTHRGISNESLMQVKTNYKKLNELLEEQEKNSTHLSQTTQQFDQSLQQQDNEWQAFREETLDQIVNNLKSKGMHLTESEIKALKTPEPLAEILRRFEQLNLKTPSFININKLDQTNYFELKIYLALHSSLNRQMQTEEITKLEKSKKADFEEYMPKNVNKNANELIKKQSHELKNLQNLEKPLNEQAYELNSIKEKIDHALKQFDLSDLYPTDSQSSITATKQQDQKTSQTVLGG